MLEPVGEGTGFGVLWIYFKGFFVEIVRLLKLEAFIVPK